MPPPSSTRPHSTIISSPRLKNRNSPASGFLLQASGKHSLHAIFLLDKPAQCRHRAAHLFRLDAVCHPEISRTPERVTRHKHQIIAHRLLAKCHGIRLERLRENIECPARLHNLKSKAYKRIIDNLHIRLIDRQI